MNNHLLRSSPRRRIAFTPQEHSLPQIRVDKLRQSRVCRSNKQNSCLTCQISGEYRTDVGLFNVQGYRTRSPRLIHPTGCK